MKDRFIRFIFHEIRQPLNSAVLGALVGWLARWLADWLVLRQRWTRST